MNEWVRKTGFNQETHVVVLTLPRMSWVFFIILCKWRFQAGVEYKVLD